MNRTLRVSLSASSLAALSVFALRVALAGPAASAPAAETCCDKAKAQGEACKHPCCVEATRLRTVCFKCNPDKATTCCDKAAVKGEACSHPCCVEAAKSFFFCTKCNKGRSFPLFDGKTLDAWEAKKDVQGESRWAVGEPSLDAKNPKTLAVAASGHALVNDLDAGGKGVHGRDIASRAVFGDALIEVEVLVPKGSNSGIYLMGEYEVQILDSHGKPDGALGQGDMGAVYGYAKPPFNASKAPGEWQSYVIDFRAPRFDDAGKKTENARLVKVTLNGRVLHEDIELKDKTPGGLTGKERASGPLMFQGDHGEVAYRNIFVTPK
jgi:hypothetical protein